MMTSRSGNQWDVRPANRKVLLAAICLSAIPCTVAGNGAERTLSGPATLWRTIQMRVTGYCPCRKCYGKYSDGKTANGHRIGQGDTFVAADKRHAFGTKMIVPGYNDSQPVDVLDRGGAIRGNHLDVFFNSHHETRHWGVRYLPVKAQVGSPPFCCANQIAADGTSS